MPKIYDNIVNHLVNGLNESLQHSKRTDFCVGYFYLSGWKQVADKIDLLEGDIVPEGNCEVLRYCRLLVGMSKTPLETIKESFAKRVDGVDMQQGDIPPLKRKLAQLFKEQLTIGIPTDADETALRKLSQQMKDKKVVVKLHLRHLLHAKLYLCYQKERGRLEGFLGSSNLTLSGLSNQGELNVDVLEQDAALKLAEWFDNRWNDRWCIDITQELIEIIDDSWAADKLLPPYHIYLKMAYHLSQEARAGLTEYSLPLAFQKELLDFQQAAVKIAAKKLDKRDGVLIGDVVGLGKTITACALAKMFEESNFFSTLIICPPNLMSMWEGYKDKFDLKAEIISVGAVQSRLRDLKRFRIVIIDESHNLRNDQGSRYRAIKNYLDENESKVILLSATPYNSSFIDLSNQLRLFIQDDKDLGISPENYVKKIGGQIQFMAKHTETFIRSIRAFEWSEFADDWRELMRLYMVRRTRSFVRDNYGVMDPATNKISLRFPDGHYETFPTRIPKRVPYQFNASDTKDIYAKLYSQNIVDIINQMDLARYGLKNYLLKSSVDSPTAKEQAIIANLSRAGKRLMGFCRTNLFKRLESSGYSFLLSLSRHILRNYVFVYAIESRLPLPIGKNISQNLDDFLEDGDTDDDTENNQLNLILSPDTYLKKAKELYEAFKSPLMEKRFDWIGSEFFSPALLKSLISDGEKIIRILKVGKDWAPEHDRKLNALCALLTKKHKDEKVLVFTQFADTANYLAEILKKRGIQKLESVTGSSENPTALATRFSPVSNGKPEINTGKNDLRILISTDVLSEGQNLQDAHIILNYDLPWAIIRLIQRAGRVDRIGQIADEIFCYSFLPEDGIEQIINLRRRLRNRISQNAEVVGSDEVFFDGDPVNLADLYNEKAGILDDDEKDTEVDLSSYALQIWTNAIKQNAALKKIIPELPNVVYATKQNTQLPPENEGVIVYTRTYDENDVLAWLNTKGEVMTQSQFTIMKAAECLPDTQALHRLENHHNLVKKGIDYIRKDDLSTGSSLGKKTGVKYKTYTRLSEYCKANEETLFVTDALKKAVDDILNFPMKEVAKDTINRSLKSGISDDELATLVISLREEDKLAIVHPEDQPLKEPQIICSLGLKNV